MSMKRKIDIKAIEKKVRENSKFQNEIVCVKDVTLSKSSISTILSNKTLNQAIEALTIEFKHAANKLNCNVNELVLMKGASNYNNWIEFQRKESKEELEKRIQEEINYRVKMIREQWKRENNLKALKKRNFLKMANEFSPEELKELIK